MNSFFKWPALILIFFNVAYLVWMLAGGETSPSSDSSPKSKVSLEGEKIVLLDELSKSELQELGERFQLENEVLASEPYCPSLGPFESKIRLEEVGQRLAKSGLSAKVRTVAIDSSEKYRVYLPSYESREKAEDVLRKLRAKKVDSYIMTDSGFMNAISLGIFSSSDSAEGLVGKMLSNGYHAKIVSTTLSKEAYWLDLEITANGGKADEVLVSLMTEMEGVTRVDSPCKVVALAQ